MQRSRKRAGFTLMEAVIALTIAVAVSITALSVALSAVTAKLTATEQAEALRFADNVWECFKAADTEEEFLANLFFAEHAVPSKDTTDGLDHSVYRYVSEENLFSAEIAVYFPPNGRARLVLTVNDARGEAVISFSYGKEVGI